MRIAITGASGVVGTHAVESLVASGADVVGLSRHPRTDSPGITWRAVNYADVAILIEALKGIDTLVFVSSDGPATEVVIHHHNIIAAARANKVKHVVMLSGLDADGLSPFCYANSYAFTEQLLRESGCAFSIARASIFTEFFAIFLEAARDSGELRLPAAEAKISLVAKADVGRCLAAFALSEPTNAHHEITGPESLSCDEIASISETAWGVPMKYVDICPTDFCKELINTGEDIWWIYAYSSMFDSLRQNRWDRVSDEVMIFTGEMPRRLHDVLSS